MRATCFSATIVAALTLATPASAARIAISSQDCGTPDLLGLTFTIGETDACEAGMVTDPSGTTALYGDPITTVGFSTDFAGSLADFLEVDTEVSLLPILTFDPTGQSFTLSGDGIDLGCDGIGTGDLLGCAITELTIQIFLDADDPESFLGTRFTVTRVNQSAIPEPGSLVLLSTGLMAVAARRRRGRRSPRVS